MIWFYLLVLGGSLALGVDARAARARGWRPSMRPRQAELFAAAASVVASAAGTVYWLIAPAYGTSSSVTATGSRTTSAAAEPVVSPDPVLTILQVEGGTALLPMLAFVGLSGLPFLFWRRAARVSAEIASAGLLASLCLLAGFSIGPVYLPSAVLMLLAALAGRSTRSST